MLPDRITNVGTLFYDGVCFAVTFVKTSAFELIPSLTTIKSQKLRFAGQLNGGFKNHQQKFTNPLIPHIIPANPKSPEHTVFVSQKRIKKTPRIDQGDQLFDVFTRLEVMGLTS